jgi:prepilin-type processing-associated H-X9-DG protein
MMQFRLSTPLLAFVVVGSSLAVFGVELGVPVAVALLAVAAFVRSPTVGKVPPPVVAVLLLVVFLTWLYYCMLLVALPVSRHVARQIDCMNNLRLIGLALQNYENVNGSLPPAVVVDEKAKATHSWRLLIMPYLDHNGVYKAYDFHEPWNGPNNGKLAAERMPDFCCPSDPSTRRRPMTSYVAVTGPGTVWDAHHAAGTPPRVMVIEVTNSNINWMEPRDLTLDEACRRLGNGTSPDISRHSKSSDGFFFWDEAKGANVAFSDGSVEFIPAGLPPETLRGLIMGDAKAWAACGEFQATRQQHIHWTNCIAVAVLVLSYALLLLRPRKAEPATPHPPAAADERGEA